MNSTGEETEKELVSIAAAIKQAYESALAFRSEEEKADSNVKSTPGAKISSDLKDLRAKLETKEGFSQEEIDIVTKIDLEDILEDAKTLFDSYIGVTEEDKKKKNVQKVDNPTICFVAGQPGCGKSNGIKIMAGKMTTPFESEMDVYRNMHPQIKKIKEIIAQKYPNDKNKQGELFVAITAVYADMLELAICSYLLSQGYNVIKETTGKNSKSITGFVNAVQSISPVVEASMACMAVSQEVSIEGTKSRGAVMKTLTELFCRDFEKVTGSEIIPVGRGDVSEGFSKACCEKIPGAMSELAKTGMFKSFIIAKRATDLDDAKVAEYTGAEVVEHAEEIGTTLASRITGELAKEETAAHISTKAEDADIAIEEAKQEDYDKLVDLYVYPTITFLKETDGAVEFYKRVSGITELPKNKDNKEDLSFLAKWVVAHTLLPKLLQNEKGLDGLHFEEKADTEAFDQAQTQANEALNQGGSSYTIIITNLAAVAEKIKADAAAKVAEQSNNNTESFGR